MFKKCFENLKETIVSRFITFSCDIHTMLKVTYHPLYSMNKSVTNKSMLPQDGAQVFPYMG